MVVVVEEYTGPEALDADLTSAHVAATLDTIGDALTSPSDIHPLKPA